MREISVLESKNDLLRNELKELESKMYQEKADKDKFQLKIEDLEKKVVKLNREVGHLFFGITKKFKK